MLNQECAFKTYQKDLLNWLSELKNKPDKVFLVHGENKAFLELAEKIYEKYGFDCVIPQMNQGFEM